MKRMTTPGAASEMLRGFLRASPLILGCLPLAFILGVQASQHGMSVVTTMLFTGMNFAGGSEFAAVALWSSAPPVLVVVFTTWLINSRHIVMGAALSLHTEREPTWRNLVSYFLMCDEVWALHMAEINRRKREGVPAAELFSFHFHIGMGLGFWSLWMGFAALGAAMGQSLGDMTRWGFMMAFPATFTALLVMMWPGFSKALPMAGAASVAALASLALPTHWCVLSGTLTGLLLAFLGFDDLGRRNASASEE